MRIAKNFIFSIVIICLFFLGLEYAQRIRYCIRYKKLCYLQFNNKKIRVYKKNTPFEKVLEKKPIVIMGGSVVYGLGEHPTISEALEEMSGKDVLNAGFIGNSSADIVRLFNEKIKPLYPEIVVLYTGFNDYRHAGIYDAAGAFGSNIVRSILGRAWAWLYNNSLLFCCIYEKKYIFSAKSIDWEYAEKIFTKYKNNIENILQTYGGIKIILVRQKIFIEGYPNFQDRQLLKVIRNKKKLTYEEAYYWMHSRILDIIDELNLKYNLFIADPKLNKDCFKDIVHLNGKGHRIIAQSINNVLPKTAMIANPAE